MTPARPALLALPSFVGAVILVCLGGCRLEGPSEAAPPGALDEPGLAEVGPPVVAGDTARVTAERAGRATPPGVPVVGPAGLVIPVVGIRPDDLVDTFEDARSEGRVHDAIDILAPRGTPVVAAAAGRVLRLFTSERGGLTVYQLGDDALAGGRRPVYYYAHLDAYAPGLAAGGRLERGGAVGTVGDTGNAAPGNTHLHFAVWTVTDTADFWDGEPLNPYLLLAGR